MAQPWDCIEAYEPQLRCGHMYTSSDPFDETYISKPGSHDDGMHTGLFLGGIGTPVCSRDLKGFFSRWHLQTGFHVYQIIREAFVGVRWSQGDRAGYFRLCEEGPYAFKGERVVYSLFPVIREHYRCDDIPFELAVEFFSPLVPGDHEASVLPVWYVSVMVKNISDERVSIDVLLSWPHMLGWRVQQMTSLDRPERSWPSQTHAGNTAAYSFSSKYAAVIQKRRPGMPVIGDMEGEIVLYTPIMPGDRISSEACLKAQGNAVGQPSRKQAHTLPWAEEHFAARGRLPDSGIVWEAHWDEAMVSALSRGIDVEERGSSRLDFVIAYDMPVVEFGSKRRWYRLYTKQFGQNGRGGKTIAEHASSRLQGYRHQIDLWHREVLCDRRNLGKRIKGAMINELYFITAGGTAWVSGCMDQRSEGLDEPLLGGGEHAAILEGYDVGYYYYNTTDLWIYAWYAVHRWWPRLAEIIFDDLLKTIPIAITDERMIYRSATMEAVLAKGKVPHDVGSVMEDPWHRLNGYQMRDDSNLWKDHNPGFIISWYLFKKRQGQTLSHDQWNIIKSAGLFMLDQISSRGLPFHDAFGDSTWDNLGIQGISAFSGSLTLAALAALMKWADSFGEREFADSCGRLLKTASDSFITSLWNGEWFTLCDSGKYAECVMADGILGFYLARLSGLMDLIPRITDEQIRSHLRSAYRYAFLPYCGGKAGPLLVASPGQLHFSGDGGDELQVNEVLAGSAWMTVAMMHCYGLVKEGRHIAASLMGVLNRGLQFRTPAAFDGYGYFRAPMNMRPLAIWFLDIE